jgi:hypothetical protein
MLAPSVQHVREGPGNRRQTAGLDVDPVGVPSPPGAVALLDGDEVIPTTQQST